MPSHGEDRKENPMLQTALSVLHKTKNAYLAARENDPVMLSGDYDVKLHLHRRSTPDEGHNAAASGKISIAMIDICMVGTVFALLSAIAAAFSLAGYIVRKLF